MAHDAIKWAYQQQAPSPSAKAVLLALAFDVNCTSRKAWPSLSRVVEHTQLSRATVQRAIKELTTANLIIKVDRKNTSSLFTLALDFPEGYHPDTPNSVGGPHHDTGGPHHDTPGGITMTYKKRIKTKNKKEKGMKQQPVAPVAQSTKEKTVKIPKGVSVSKVVAATKLQYEDKTDEELITVEKKGGKITAASLAACWRNTHGKYGSGVLPVITGKQQGQLRNAYVKVGDAVLMLILAVMKDWPAFVSKVKSETSAFNHPTQPDIGYFSQHAVTAMNFVLDKEVAENEPDVPTLAEKKSEPKPVQSIAKDEPIESAKLSLSDIEDVLSDL